MKKVIVIIFWMICGGIIIGGVYFSFSGKNFNQVLIKNLVMDVDKNNLETPADIGIVLGGGLRANGELSNLSKERVDFATRYYQETRLPLLFSGGDTPFGVEAVEMNKYSASQGYDGPDHIEGSSRSTYENAFFTEQLLEESKLPIQTVLVFTSSYHSRRALATFKTLMPDKVVGVVYPEESAVLDNTIRGRWHGFYAISREYVAIWWYKISHSIDFS